MSNRKDVYAGLSTRVTTRFAVLYVQQIYTPDLYSCRVTTPYAGIKNYCEPLRQCCIHWQDWQYYTPRLMFPLAAFSSNLVYPYLRKQTRCDHEPRKEWKLLIWILFWKSNPLHWAVVLFKSLYLCAQYTVNKAELGQSTTGKKQLSLCSIPWTENPEPSYVALHKKLKNYNLIFSAC